MASEYPEGTWGINSGGSDTVSESCDQIRCSIYPGIRLRDHRGEWVPGSCKVLGNQEKEALVDSCSMATWICGVIVIKLQNEPTHTSLPFVNILSNTSFSDRFIVCGELSEKGVHHTHFLCRTNSRLDSVRRTILNAQRASEYDFDVCKLATCRYWFGMFCYLLKNPLLVFCSDQPLADLSFTVIEKGQTLRYLKTPEVASAGKDVVRCINDIIQSNDCRSTEDVYMAGGERLVKFLHMSSLDNIIKNCLQYTHSRDRTWDPRSFRFAPDCDARPIHNILEFQGIDVQEFDTFFWKWITRTNGKVNTLIFQGPSNTGKSVFVRGLAALCRAGSIINTSSPFYAEGICGANLGLWEEPLLTAENAEMFKLISEGSPVQLPQKFKKPYNHPGCPILITTNHDICRFCISEEGTIMNRCKVFWFSNPISSSQRICSRDCLNNSRVQRRSTPCRLNWCQRGGDFSREPRSSGFCSESGEYSETSGRHCGRWWCGGNNNRRCSYCSGPSLECSDTGRSSFGASTSISGDDRSSREHSPRSSGNGIRRDRSPESSVRTSGESGRNPRERSPGDREQPRRRLGRSGISFDSRRSGTTTTGTDSISGRGRIQSDTDSSEAKTRPSSSRIPCTCLVEPLAQDWQAYLCFLARQNDRT
uniref:Nonstructural protein n=1 Tax=Turdus pallidus Chaphamaparvovirus TaxID=2794492 RepID=A0A8A4XCL4_9VIRU|nr:MAG: nonstructural protein [Turdus pallidus Chaphamaparvovirus]